MHHIRGTASAGRAMNVVFYSNRISEESLPVPIRVAQCSATIQGEGLLSVSKNQFNCCKNSSLCVFVFLFGWSLDTLQRDSVKLLLL